MRTIRLIWLMLYALTLGRAISAQTYVFSILAGARAPAGWVDGVGSDARFYSPAGLAFDRAGNLFVADAGNAALRMITPARAVTTVAMGATGAVATDTAGNVYFASGPGTLAKWTPSVGVTVLAGAQGSARDGAGTNARFAGIAGLAVDAQGNIYVADPTTTVRAGLSAQTYAGNSIRKVSPDGTVTTLAGVAGMSGDRDGSGTEARFANPTALAIAADGTLYVLDVGNHAIRKVTPAGVVTTFASDPTLGSSIGLALGPSGTLYTLALVGHFVAQIDRDGRVSHASVSPSDAYFVSLAVDAKEQIFAADRDDHMIARLTGPGPVTWAGAPLVAHPEKRDGWNRDASFGWARGFAFDAAGNVYVADIFSANADVGCVRRITPAGVVTTLAALPLKSLGGFAGNGRDTFYVSDEMQHAIYRVTIDGVVTAFAGTPGAFGQRDGEGPAARFWVPKGLAVDRTGNVYVADCYNQAIRKITPDGTVTTLAGRFDTPGYADGVGNAALFRAPEAVAVDLDGNVLVSDTANFVIRKITPTGVVSTVAGMPRVQGAVDGQGSTARFLAPVGIAVDADNSVLVWDYALRKVTADGRVSTLRPTFERLGPFSYGAPILEPSLGIAPDGRLYAITAGVIQAGKVAASVGTFANFSARATVSAASLTLGFVVHGDGRTVLLRGVGPGLARFGVSTPLATLRLDLHSGPGLLASNTTWGASPEANQIASVGTEVGAFPLHPAGRDAALLRPLADGAFTTTVTALSGSTGSALAECYLTSKDAAGERFANFSARASLSESGNRLIVGFVITGDLPIPVLLRAAGPSLAAFAVTDAVAKTKLELYAGDTLVATNEGWGTSPDVNRLPTLARAAGAFPFATNSGDSALLVELRPGTYSLHVIHPSGGSGSVLAEAYEVAP